MINKNRPILRHHLGHKHYRGDYVQMNIDFYERIDGIKDQINSKRVLKALKNKRKGGDKK